MIECETPADYVPTLQESAIVADLTVALGDLLRDPVAQVAAEFTGRSFALLDSAVDLPNVQSITFREQEGYYLAGILAAMTSANRTLGIVGGIRVPPLVRAEVGFIAGARSVDPGIEVLVGYADSFEDSTIARELAAAQLAQGADIVLPMAGRASDGAHLAVSEATGQPMVISADADKRLLAEEIQLAVVHKHVDRAMLDVITSVVNGTYTPASQVRGLREQGIEVGTYHSSVSQATRDAITDATAAIVDGDVVVPSTDDELEAFL